MYNLTGLDNSSNIGGVFQTVNTLSDGLLVIGLMVALYLIVIIVLKDYNMKQALVVAGLFTSGTGFFLFIAGIVGSAYVTVPVVLTVMALALVLFSD